MRHHGQLPREIRTAIRQARAAQGRSQSDVARSVGLTQKHVSNIETGRVVPRFDTLLELAWSLNLDLVVIPRGIRPLVLSLARGRAGPDAAGGAEAAWFTGLTDEGEQEDDDDGN